MLPRNICTYNVHNFQVVGMRDFRFGPLTTLSSLCLHTYGRACDSQIFFFFSQGLALCVFFSQVVTLTRTNIEKA